MAEPRGGMSKVNHTDVVRDVLITKLIYGEYMPGHVFKLREMLEDEAFRGMSQTPIREALLQLVAKNILVGQRGFSTRVPIPSVEHLTEVRAIRTKLEVMAALQHLDDWTATDIERLEGFHACVLAARHDGDIGMVLRCNAQFHMALCRMEHTSYLRTMIQTLWAITGPSIRFLYEKGPLASFAQRHPHDDMIAALKTKDAKLLERALVRDLSSCGDQIIEVLREKITPEALAVQPFKKIELVRDRQRAGRQLQKVAG